METVIFSILGGFGIFFFAVLFMNRSKPTPTAPSIGEEGEELRAKILDLGGKRERLERLMELVKPDESPEVRELYGKQATLHQYLKNNFDNYCVLLLKYSAVDIIESTKTLYADYGNDPVELIKGMRLRMMNARDDMVRLFNIRDTTRLDEEYAKIVGSFQEIIKSIVIIETNKIIEKLSPIDEKSRIIEAVDSQREAIDYRSNKQRLDEEYDRFIAETELL